MARGVGNRPKGENNPDTFRIRETRNPSLLVITPEISTDASELVLNVDFSLEIRHSACVKSWLAKGHPRAGDIVQVLSSFLLQAKS